MLGARTYLAFFQTRPIFHQYMLKLEHTGEHCRFVTAEAPQSLHAYVLLFIHLHTTHGFTEYMTNLSWTEKTGNYSLQPAYLQCGALYFAQVHPSWPYYKTPLCAHY